MFLSAGFPQRPQGARKPRREKDGRQEHIGTLEALIDDLDE